MDPDREAPVPLCGEHLRIAFAYVMLRAENVSDTPLPLLPPPPVVDVPEGWVYFIRKGGLVKIGWSSQPSVRFKQLRPDEVLATMPGSMRDERDLHGAFSHLREHGEWFRPEPDLLAFIDGLKAA